MRRLAAEFVGTFLLVFAGPGAVIVNGVSGGGVFVDGFRPDRRDLLGALVCIAGVLAMVLPARG